MNAAIRTAAVAVGKRARGVLFSLFRNLLPLRARADRMRLLTGNLETAVKIGAELAVIERRRGLADAPRDPARMTRLLRLHTEGKGRLQLLLDGRRMTDEEVDSLIWALWQRLKPFDAGEEKVGLLDLVEEIMEFLGEAPGDERFFGVTGRSAAEMAAADRAMAHAELAQEMVKAQAAQVKIDEGWKEMLPGEPAPAG